MSTIDRLRALFAGVPEDLAKAWQEAGELVSTLVESRDNGALAAELEAAREVELEAAFIREVREVLVAEKLTDADYVIFATSEWDNGSFFNCMGDVFTGEESVEVDFGQAVDETMTGLYGCVSNSAGLGLHLRTEAVEFDDYIGNVREKMAKAGN